MSTTTDPDTSRSAIGKRLTAVRVARGLTAGALAQALRISPQRWNTYEQGRSTPPPDVLSKLWQITGATSDYVLFNRMDGLPMELYARLTAANAKSEKSA
jgi:transcriptional regulator with XRE-family HTH domain